MAKIRYCTDCNKIGIDFYAVRCKKCSNKIKWIGKTGENSPHWKGDSATYKQKHSYINRVFGKAYKCENNPKHKGFFEWANISGKYKRSMSDWKMMCHSCNQKMDYKRRMENKKCLNSPS